VLKVTIDEIRRKLEMLFTWSEREFRERNEKPGEDPTEIAMLMDAILQTLVAIWVAELPE
jgi:hypothetical protein